LLRSTGAEELHEDRGDDVVGDAVALAGKSSPLRVWRDAYRAVHGETGDQIDQESRSATPRAAPTMTVMDITIHSSPEVKGLGLDRRTEGLRNG
jgi:hypothetical protein